MTLHTRITSKDKLNPELIREYCKGILLALDYLHRHSVVHKNLKVWQHYF